MYATPARNEKDAEESDEGDYYKSLERQIRMENDNILVERDFDISLDGQSHKVKAVAVFVRLGFEVGYYHLNFTLRGQLAENSQPDETRYSREQAKRAAEFAFSSGQVEARARSQIQEWIYLGY